MIYTTQTDASDSVIMQVQRKLLENGYDPGPVDGVMGKKTIDAIKKFQDYLGYVPTGNLDLATLDDLDIKISPEQKMEILKIKTYKDQIYWRDDSGKLMEVIECNPNEDIFFSETWVPCGGTIIRTDGQIGGTVYSSDSLALCVLKNTIENEKESNCQREDYECYKKAHQDAINTCSK